MNKALLATSPTLDGITKLVNEFFYSTSYHLIFQHGGATGVWAIVGSKGILPGFSVRLKNRRYRFERTPVSEAQ